MTSLPDKPPKNKYGKRRWNLWMKDPHCHYCKNELEWKETTLEHLYSKVKTGRREPPNGKGETVIACGKCNNDQARTEFHSLTRAEQWMRTGAYPRIIRGDLTLQERLVIIKILWLKRKPNGFNFNIKMKRTDRLKGLDRKWRRKKRAWVSSGSYPRLSRGDLSWQDKIFIIYHKLA